MILDKEQRLDAANLIRGRHYTQSVPSGKSHYSGYETALVVWAIPANKNISSFLVGKPGVVWELARLWAPDGHEKSLLTRAIAEAVVDLQVVEREVAAVVSYADPFVGHHGGVYRAASWVYCGRTAETRFYKRGDTILPRRAFHSGKRGLRKEEIEALGYAQVKGVGKERYARGLTKWARKEIHRRFVVPSNILARIGA